MKRIFALLSVAAIALALAMTGCGRGDDNGGDTTTPTTAAVTQAPADNVTDPGTGDDTGGNEVLGHPTRDYGALRGTTIFVYHQSVGTNLLQDAADFEAEHGVTIRIEDTPWAQYYSRLMSLVTAGDPPDIFDSNDEVLPMYALREIAIPLDGLYTPNAPFLDFAVMHGMRYMGETFILQEVGRVPHLIFYNMTMFNRYGLPTPTELYNQGDWTVQRMFDISSEFTADIDNTGEYNQWGFTATSVYMLFGANQVPIVNYDPNAGQFTLAINGANQIAVLQHALDAVARNDIHRFGWYGDLFSNGRLAMMGHEAWFANSLLAMEDDWSIAPFPTGQFGNAGYNFIRPWGVSVATGANNPMGGVAFVEFQYARNMERGSEFFNQGWMNPAREAGVRAAMDKTSWFSLHNGIPNFRTIADQITLDLNVAEGRTATDIVNAQLSAMQSYIDDFNNLIPGWEEPRVFENPGVVDFEDGTLGWLTWEPEEWMNMTRTIIDDGIDGRSLHIEFAEGYGTWVPILGTLYQDFVFVGGQAYVISFDYHVLRVVPDEWHVFYTTSPDMMWSQYYFVEGQYGRFEMTIGAEGDHDQKEFRFRVNGIREMIIDNFEIRIVEF